MLRYRTLYLPRFVFYIQWKSVRLELLTSIYIIFVHTILNSRSYSGRDGNIMKLSRQIQWVYENMSTNFQED